MTRSTFWIGLFAATIASAGCGGGSIESGGSGGRHVASPYDQGPRAADAPVIDSLAQRGRDLFQTKGCAKCHAYGKRVTGPDLAGVTRRRSAGWIERQILQPDVMAREDPISRDLLADFPVPMANLGLTSHEARALIEYLKMRDEQTK